jgi:hypothetical protein
MRPVLAAVLCCFLAVPCRADEKAEEGNPEQFAKVVVRGTVHFDPDVGYTIRASAKDSCIRLRLLVGEDKDLIRRLDECAKKNVLVVVQGELAGPRGALEFGEATRNPFGGAVPPPDGWLRNVAVCSVDGKPQP